MKVACATLMMLLSVESAVETETLSETFVQQVEVEREPARTPILDGLVDWDEVERQNECLWLFLQESEVELTLESVWAAGEWTDALGGACAVIGEQDED